MKMTGVRPHPRTGVLWLRLRTPAHLINCRAKLEALGVSNFRVEHHRSLGTRDRRKAGPTYVERRSEIQQRWREWEALLESGPQALSYKNVAALAGEQAKAFLEAHEDNPFDAPPPFSVPDLPLSQSAVAEMLKRLDPETRGEYAAYMAQIPALPEEQRLERIWLSLEKYPFQRILLGPVLVEALEAMFGPQADAILESQRLHVDRATRSLLHWELLRFMGVAGRALESRVSGDWGPVREFAHIPQFEPQLPSVRPQPARTLTFAAVIDEQERLSQKHLEKQKKSPSTIENYRKEVRKFCEWRGDESVTTVTRREVVRWRDEMIDAIDKGTLASKTVRNRLGVVSAVVGWAIQQNKRRRLEDQSEAEIFADGHPLRGIDLPEWIKKLSEDLTYPVPLAAKILYAAREQIDPAKRWVPWLEALSGMRIGEAEQLEKRDLQSYGGYYYLLVRSDETRTTKSHKSRRVPLHKALIAEGFLEFVNAAPDGRLFPGGKAMRSDLTTWIREVAEADGGLGDVWPNHGFRHLFEDLAEGNIEFAARSYLTGRALPNSAEDYGRSAAKVPKLAKMLNKIKPLVPLRKAQ